ncbi:hypothetical protein KKF61_00075 [Patescibacteria group bacterium]|nr:hypothetical protein [Patescibacteria group bacterium]MBU0964052.1 hypothetical protein [Patescibacteria group bacterium]
MVDYHFSSYCNRGSSYCIDKTTTSRSDKDVEIQIQEEKEKTRWLI